ncbi:hypothetical protein [Paenibacillus sp. R14(2021)]|uniref:hypothetical protein n=1 Tax=Paenibacillus sp. R14(2021) TaxID=2859228 RepID=UPI001C611C6B|nr:hypothetical protein [Paenibacillus sp. R14(2021)]
MFRVFFRFIDDNLNLISRVSAEQFDNIYGDISGQIELNFNGNVEGYFHKDVPFGNELVLHWFRRLTEAVVRLQDSNYIAMNVVENNNWIEFHREGRLLRVRLIINPSLKGIRGFFSDTPFSKFEDKQWNNSIIDFDEFRNEIYQSTIKLLDQLQEINVQLLHTNEVNRIKEFLKLINQQ